MATAKCARVITNEYAEQSYYANKKGKDSGATVKKEYKDEKSVKNALREMKEGEFELYLPEDEGYENSLVEVKNYVEPKEEPVYFKPNAKVEEEDDEDEEISTEELMGASTVYEEDAGFSVEDAE